VRSRRPFDFRGFELAGSANATYADLAKDWAWNGNLLASNRWDVGDGGEIGALLNISYTELTYNDDTRFVSGDFFGINPDLLVPGTFRDNFGNNIPGVTVRVPVGVGLFMNAGKRWRPSGNASIQWKVNPDLQIYVDGLYQGFRREVSDRLLFVPLFGGGATYSNVTLDQTGDSGFDYPGTISATGQVRPEGFQAATWEKTNTYQVGVGAVHDTDTIRIAGDIARTKSQFDLSIYSVDYAFTSNPDVDVVFDTDDGDGGADFTLNGFDTTDLANYRYRGFFDRHLTAKGDDFQMRLDTTLKRLADWVTGIDLGVRYSMRDAGFSDGSRYSPQEGLGMPFGSLPLDFHTVTWRFRDNVEDVNQLILPTYDSIRDSIEELRTLAGFAQGRPPADPRVTYTADENALAGYAQLRYNFDVGSIPIDGAIGLRAVQTTFKLNGTSLEVVPGGPPRLFPLEVKNKYTDYLPNVSIRAHLTPQLQARLAYTETRRRPDFAQLNPGLIIDPPGGGVRTGRGGNPNLKPITSSNYDASLEYYFSRTGFAAVALFRRDVKNFIADFVAPQEVDGIGTVNVFGPANISKGKIKGVEAQFRTFFDFAGVPLWAQGFGTELNLTYIDNKLEDLEFPDVSKWTYNLVGFYEHGPITARLAYNYRSKYTQFFVANPTGGFGGEFTKGVSRLDGSISYTLNDNLMLAADVSNILGKPFRNYRQIEPGIVFPRDVRYEERVYSIGIRARLGGDTRRASEPEPAVAPPPPPPPPVEPAPVVEQPAPPPPPPPPSGQRG
jgi:TonB-dependent receptor